MARQGEIAVGEEAVSARVRRIYVYRFVPFRKRELIEAQVAVNRSEVRGPRGEVLIEEKPRAVNRTVVVQLNRFLNIFQRFDRPIERALRERPVERGGRIFGVGRLGERPFPERAPRTVGSYSPRVA